MHSPTNLPTKSEAACCTVRVFNTGAMWICMLCAGLLTPSGWSSENIALLCVFFALHNFASFLAFAFAWGPTLKILLWCDESSPDLDMPFGSGAPVQRFTVPFHPSAPQGVYVKLLPAFNIIKAKRGGFTYVCVSCRPSAKKSHVKSPGAVYVVYVFYVCVRFV